MQQQVALYFFLNRKWVKYIKINAEFILKRSKEEKKSIMMALEINIFKVNDFGLFRVLLAFVC